jgi:hypothetical protein
MSPSPASQPSIVQALAGLPGAASRKSGSAPSGAFCAEGRLALDALALEVAGIGPLGSPVSPEAARSLHAASRPARHGLRQETRLDKSVRDTGESGADALTLRWSQGALPALMAEIARGLGLPALEAHAHNLLVYGPGQFFKPHQDTEKQRGMVATLVLVWPSAHIGGELQVRRGDEDARFASQHLRTDALRWFAFYADCRHEVLPVTEGWRIVLTFDLVLPREAALPPSPVHPPLLAALRTQFQPEGEAPSTTPWVLLLDHQYTEHGLRWPLLKSDDRRHAAALRAAAQALGLTVHLALAEIHQHWSAAPAYGGRRGGAGEPTRDELIEEDMALDFWVDADDRPLRRDALPIALNDVASLTDTDESFLVDEEYEGYMGNYGETLDYWYRRAAIVIQTPLADEASRFVTDFDGALADALALARKGQGAEVVQRLRAAARAVEAQRARRGRDLLGRYAKLAAALPDAEQASWLCQGFSWVDLEPGHAAALARLAARWGVPWTQALVQGWAEPGKPWQARGWGLPGADMSLPWPRSLAKFVRACQRARLDPALVEELLDRCHTALAAADKALEAQTPAHRKSTLDQRLRALCELAAALQLSANHARHIAVLVRYLQAQPGLYPLTRARPLLEALPSGADAPPEVQAMRAAVLQALQQALAQPEPAADDHSLDQIEWACRCADCRPVIDWAGSPTAQPLTLAMAEGRRAHVQSKLEAAAAPIHAETVKRGSPYKLLLRKPGDLPARRRAVRQAWADDLAALAPN